METRFQTSFIPKKAMPAVNAGLPARPSRPSSAGSIFNTIATLMFLASLLSVGAVFGWKQYQLNLQDGYKNDLAAREKGFDLNLIETLKTESEKITFAKSLLADHLAMSKIFGVISALTAEEVRFTSMTVAAPTSPGGTISVSLSGYGKDLSAVAFQSDVLGQLDQYGLSNIVKNPILSNPSLNQVGTVSFGLTATVKPTNMSYEDEFKAAAGSSASTTQQQ